MTFKDKPPVWQLGDFIAFGLGGVVCLGFIFFGLFVGFQGDSAAAKQAPFLLALTGLAFIGIWARIVQRRKQKMDAFQLIGAPEYGFLVNWGGLAPPGSRTAQLELCVEAMVQGWSNVFGAMKVLDAVEADYIQVFFKPGPLVNPQTGESCTGYTVGRTCVIGYKSASDPVVKTSFQHELGHVIQTAINGPQDEDTQHAFAKASGLP